MSAPSRFTFRVSRLTPLALLLLFWAISIFNLDRYPDINDDEVWILSPGYKLFTQGIYGSDLLAGFHHIELRYFEFLPLMAILQGASTHTFGVGVFQLRFLPIALGTLTLALTYATTRKLFGASIAILAMWLLLCWQWTPAGIHPFASGVPLVDLSRIARYDILVPPLNLAAWWCFMRARETQRSSYDFLSGLFVGFAGLAHLYGLFWGIALLLLLALDSIAYHTSRITLRASHFTFHASLVIAGITLAWLPWVLAAGWYRDDYLGQNFQYSDRFALLNPSFYFDNLLNEPRRYRLGVSDWSTRWRVGFWCLMSFPIALLATSVRAIRERQQALRWLLLPTWVLLVCFALLIKIKQYNYVALLAPLFAMVMACAIQRLMASRWRVVTMLLLTALITQGVYGWIQLHQSANQVSSPTQFFAELRDIVPPATRVLGLPRYWLALTEHAQAYRSWVLPFDLASPHISQYPISLDAALEQVAPHAIIFDSYTITLLTAHDTPSAAAISQTLSAYLQRHRARRIGELRDHHGALVQVYQLDP